LRSRIQRELSAVGSASDTLDKLLNMRSRVYVDLVSGTFCSQAMDSGNEEFVEIVYEKVLGYIIDMELGKIVTDTAIYCPNRDVLLYIKADSDVKIIEAKGKRIYPLVSEGDRVSFGNKLFYIVTGKNEVRVIKSDVRGVVVFIGEVFSNGIQQEVMTIIEEGEVREFTRCRY